MNLVNRSQLADALLRGAPLRATGKTSFQVVKSVGVRESGTLKQVVGPPKDFTVTGITLAGDERTVHVRVRD